MYDVATDANGNHFLGAAASSELGDSLLVVPAYRKGTFRTDELTGLDAAAVAELGRLIQGSVANGLLQLA
jgi:hypothetical protein